MSYKTILVHVDQSRHAPERIKIAAKMAIAENAHLIGTAMTGISRFIYQDSAIFLPIQIDSLIEEAKQALRQFEAIAAQAGVLSYETRLIDDDPEGGLSLQTRYSDLVVIGQTDPDDTDFRVISDLPEYVMLNAARPVLVIPYIDGFDRIGANVLIAWNGSIEATRAVANAIPLLKRAENVAVAVFNPSAQYNLHGEQPGADIALYLARHNIKVDVVQETGTLDVGNALLSMAADKGADLIVAGGYGHTRFREVLLGGVTHTLLRTMTIPVLMSH